MINCDDTLNNNPGGKDNTCTVTFELEGGNVLGNSYPVKIKIEPGNALPSAPQPLRGESRFLGWFTEKNGAGQGFDPSSPVFSDLTVYANWLAFVVPSVLHGEWRTPPREFIFNISEPLAKLGEFCCGYAVSRPAGCETCNFQRLLLQN